MKCTQLEEMKAVRGLIFNDSNTVITNLNNYTNTEAQLTNEPHVEIHVDSGRQSSSSTSSSDTYVISRSSSVGTVVSVTTSEGKSNNEEMNESMTSVVSEASSIGSSVSLESRESGKAGRGLRLPMAKPGRGIPTKPGLK